ncbi:MAG TPA: hypothetical protein VN625_08685 [Desulfuromonadaceae bacterium]|nr:hypothetical protein [Desulfuromonadaceae bacterium]
MKKNLILIAGVLLLATVYVIFFTDWFKPKIIQISHTARPGVGRGDDAVPMLAFGLDNEYELTDIKVVRVSDLQADKDPQPLWHLVSEGSDFINHFRYGENIAGMDPAVDGSKPGALEPGVTYRLFVVAGKAHGQHDFQVKSAAK